MNLRPLADRIAVRRLERNETTPGGVACGPGKERADGGRTEPRVKAGDQVLCGKYSGAEITVEGVKFCLLREDDLLAVIEAE